jgi:hypothetical protein
MNIWRKLQVFVFEAQALRVLDIRKERSNDEDKYVEFRPEGLAFFWPLITMFARYPPRRTPCLYHDNQSKIFASKCPFYFY